MIPRHVAVCPKTGRHLRAATPEEIQAYEAQPVRLSCNPRVFFTPVRVGEVLVDELTESVTHVDGPWNWV